MDLQEQLYITTIADCESITRAAGVLHISQPALSKFLNNTEQRLGFPLFRRGKTLQPTEYGQLYLEKARQILLLGEEFRQEAAQLAGGGASLHLKVGIQSLRAPRLTPCIYMAFGEAFPMGKLQIVDDTQAVIIEQLRAGELDLVLSNDVGLPESWERVVLRQDHLLLVSGEQDPPRPCGVTEGLPVVDLRTLGDRTFRMLTPKSSTYMLGRHLLAASGIRPVIKEGTARHEATLNMVAMSTDLGFTFDSYLPLLHLMAPLRTYRILQEPAAVNYVMCCRPGQFAAPMKERLGKMFVTAIARQDQRHA